MPVHAYSSMVPATINPPDKPISQGYFIPGVDMLQWQIPFTEDKPKDRRPLDSEPLLYDRLADPSQRDNLWSSQPYQAARMKRTMRDALAALGAPSELFHLLDLMT